MKRQLPLLICFLAGFIMVVQYFIPHPPFSKLEELFLDFFQIMASFAIVLGVLNLVVVNSQRLKKSHFRSYYAIVVLLSFAVMTVVGLFKLGVPLGKGYNDTGTPFNWLFTSIYTPLSATMFALLAFFVASASYRAFRARTREATVLLVAAFVVMLGRVPIGDMLTGFLPEGWRLGNLADWIMAYPNMAAARAIMIGAALGAVSTSLRILLGIERGYLGGD